MITHHLLNYDETFVGRRHKNFTLRHLESHTKYYDRFDGTVDFSQRNPTHSPSRFHSQLPTSLDIQDRNHPKFPRHIKEIGVFYSV